ncbi:MAG: saccharopine dehydrogenase family protein [Candidatus Kariarchaeaceae archaeon]
MKSRILLLGVGMQGKAALYDLCQQDGVEGVIAADINIADLNTFIDDMNLGAKVTSQYLDVNDERALFQVLKQDIDVVIDLLPSKFNDIIATQCVDRGLHLINASYATPHIRELNERAKEKGVIILPEFGLDPGLDLLLLGAALNKIDNPKIIRSYGAGLPDPSSADNPLKYKVTWTLEGVLRSYNQLGTALLDGNVINLDSHEVFSKDKIHFQYIDGLGDLEAFVNGDSIKFALEIGVDLSEMNEFGRYTLRYPGHCAFWKKIIELQLIDDEEIEFDGKQINKRHFFTHVLEPQLILGPKDIDIALVRIEVVGDEDQVTYQILDRRDLNTGFTAMARTVGFTISIGVHLIMSGILEKRGVLSPLKDIPLELVENELAKRGIFVQKS